MRVGIQQQRFSTNPMAKGKGKRRSEDGAAKASETKATAPTSDAAHSLSDLSEGVLANLTKNIEQKLQGDEKSRSGSRKKSADRNKEATHSSVKATSAEKKGKKRDRGGKVIPPNNSAGSDGPKVTKEEDALKQEIYAIGGSQEDYDLLAAVESDSEVDGSDGASRKQGGKKTENDTLRKDIAKLLGNGDKALPTESKREERSSQKQQQPKLSKPSNRDDKMKKKLQNDNAKVKETPTLPGAKRRSTAVPPRPDWYAASLPELPSTGKENVAIARSVIDNIRKYADSLLEAENDAFAKSQQSSSSTNKFYSTIVASGTLGDKISALTLVVQESPLHNTKAIDTLVGLARKRSRAQALEVLRSLKDLFSQGTLLPSDRRLRSISHQPGLLAAFEGTSAKWTSGDELPHGVEQRHLIIWAFEDFLKERYFEILKILEVWCNDEIEFSRSRGVSYVYELLKEKPEQESNLLRLLVNKLGDPTKRIASRASYLLLQLEQAHPLMKVTIISAIEAELLFRPGQSKHAQYYAVITLNQTVLSGGEEKVAVQLLDIYFSLFASILKSQKEESHSKTGNFARTKGHKRRNRNRNSSTPSQSQEEELREKLISAVLTGVNRAYPFTSSSTERLTRHIDTLFRITHSSNFNTSIQALVLIQQLSSTHRVSADRFYRTLYESLLDPRIATSSKQSMYLNLLYRALKSDVNMTRVKAFIKRLVQILGLHQPSFICGVFYLIRELEVTFPSLSSWIDQPEDQDSDEEEVFRDVPDEDEATQAEQSATTMQQARRGGNVYDSRKRDPEQTNADKSCLWELLPYLSHFHPSVSVGAVQLLRHEKMSGKPDLTIHTLSHFLDRFIYRNPKAAPALRGSSIMQPLAGGDTSGLLVTSGRSGKGHDPVNSEAFWRQKSENVAADDVFFHDYFNRLGKDRLRIKKKAEKKKRKAGDEDEESEAESEVWKALVDSRPEVGAGLESDEEDFDMEDYEGAMGDNDGDEVEDGINDEAMESGSEGGVIFNDEDDSEATPQETGAAHAGREPGREDDEFESEDGFNLEASDDEGFRDSDEDLPSDIGVEEEPQADEKKGGEKGEKRRKLRHLPMFASADDYAALLDQESPEDGL